MKNYLKYKLRGFSGLKLRSNNEFKIDNKFINKIFINDDIDTMLVVLNDNIVYEERSKEIENYLNHICFNMIMYEDIELQRPVRILEQVHQDHKIQVKDSLRMRDSYSIISTVDSKNFYENIVEKDTAIKRHSILYERIFRTLHNPNKLVQFLSLYELLMELVSKGKRKEQKNVVEYIKSNRKNYSKIEFYKTKRPGKNFEEDIFTHLRNEVAHCEKTNDMKLYTKLGNQIDNTIIKSLVTVLNDVILELE